VNAMVAPKVTELPLRLESVTPDPFIAGAAYRRREIRAARVYHRPVVRPPHGQQIHSKEESCRMATPCRAC
jgi:hypothetical protein